jgi:hypothetical protein
MIQMWVPRLTIDANGNHTEAARVERMAPERPQMR